MNALLALACKDTSNDVKYMATFWDHLHLYFDHTTNRTAALKAAPTTLGLSDLKMKVYYLLDMLSFTVGISHLLSTNQ